MNNEGQQALENARGEVITSSSLHNKQIVGYYTAWMEKEYTYDRMIMNRWGNTLLPSHTEYTIMNTNELLELLNKQHHMKQVKIHLVVHFMMNILKILFYIMLIISKRIIKSY